MALSTLALGLCLFQQPIPLVDGTRWTYTRNGTVATIVEVAGSVLKKSQVLRIRGSSLFWHSGDLIVRATDRDLVQIAYVFQGSLVSGDNDIRLLPTKLEVGLTWASGDFSAKTAWEVALVPKNRYQNGAYWGTPTGWVCYAIARVDYALAQQLAREFIAELREGDFRQGPEFGSPWECMHPERNHRQNPVYLTSVTCPLAAFRRIEAERQH